MWTVTSSVLSRTFDQAYGGGDWRYNLEGKAQQFGFEEDEFWIRMKESRAIVSVGGCKSANRAMLEQGFSLSKLTDDKKYSSETGASWIKFYDKPSDCVYINVVLGNENEFIVENMLNEAMRYPHLLFAMTINMNFSSVGYDPKVRRITKKRFLQGKAAFSEGAPEVSLVVRRS